MVKSLSFCLSVKLLISPSYLNEFFSGYSNVGCRFFSHHFKYVLPFPSGLKSFYWKISCYPYRNFFVSYLLLLVFVLCVNLINMYLTQVQFLGQEDPLEDGLATHSSIPAWRIPWTEEAGRLWSMESQRLGHDWSNLACMHANANPFTETPTTSLQSINIRTAFLCFLSRENPLEFVEELVWWCWILSAFACL